MLNSPKFGLYKNSLCFTFIDNVLELLNKYGIPPLAEQVEALQKVHDQMNVSFKKEISSAKTGDLKELDKQRDRAIRGITILTRSYEYHFEENKVRASDAILRSIRKYAKNIAQLSYQEETGVLQNLIEDWNTETSLQEAIALLGLEAWKKELARANEAFDEMYLARTQESAKKQTIVSTSAIRKKVEEQYEQVEQHILANSILNPSTELTELIGDLNALTEKYNTEASRRIRKNEGNESVEEDLSTEEE